MKVQNSNTGTRSLRDARILELNDGEPVRFNAAGNTGDLGPDLAEYLTKSYGSLEVPGNDEGEEQDDDNDDETH